MFFFASGVDVQLDQNQRVYKNPRKVYISVPVPVSVSVSVVVSVPVSVPIDLIVFTGVCIDVVVCSSSRWLYLHVPCQLYNS